ncbi:MAG: glycosyltransferase [Plesiomonas sp.]|nr:glycosyltransferase [Plesiomonas sp.]
MLLSIVVLSYNRPEQLDRILSSLVGVSDKRVNLIIKDDQSPRFEEIVSVFNKNKSRLDFEVILHRNEQNLGYDRNLIDAFNITDSKYIFLLSDDDYIEGANIENLLSYLEVSNKSIHFTPYFDIDTGCNNRVCLPSEHMLINDFADFIYNSILFSGLIYSREAVLSLNVDMDFLSNCIYSQVYIAVILAYKSKCYGVAPEGILVLGGDGENFFGKNKSAKNKDLLSNRHAFTSNLNYQPFLLKTINKVAQVTSNEVERVFLREYKKRLVSYGLRARAYGLVNHHDFVVQYLKSKVPFFVLPFICFLSFYLLPSNFASKLNDIGRKFSRHSG